MERNEKRREVLKECVGGWAAGRAAAVENLIRQALTSDFGVQEGMTLLAPSQDGSLACHRPVFLASWPLDLLTS